jgi:hypothetical protein
VTWPGQAMSSSLRDDVPFGAAPHDRSYRDHTRKAGLLLAARLFRFGYTETLAVGTGRPRGRLDSVALLEEQNLTREPELVPVPVPSRLVSLFAATYAEWLVFPRPSGVIVASLVILRTGRSGQVIPVEGLQLPPQQRKVSTKGLETGGLEP